MRLSLSVILILLVVAIATAVRQRETHGSTMRKKDSVADLFGFDYESNDSDENRDIDAHNEDDSFPFADFDFDSLTGEAGHKATGFLSKVLGSLFNEIGDEKVGAEAAESGHESLVDFLHVMRPWWKGQNICSRTEERVERGRVGQVNGTDVDGTSLDSRWRLRSVINGMSTSCVDLGDVYKCTMKVMRDGETKTKTLVYECCQGFARADREKGCTKEVELYDLKTTLENLNLTRFLEAIDLIGMDDLITEGNNYTYFVPSNAAWDAHDESDRFEAIVAKTADKNEPTRNIIKAHVLPGWQYSYDWFDDMVVNTTEPDSSIRINFYSSPRPFSTANCARITSTNHKATNGIIHQVDGVLTPTVGTLWDLLSDDQQFSKFLSLIDEKLQDRLMDPNEHLTVLAFTNDVQNRLPSSVLKAITEGSKCFKDLILEHIFPHTICSVAVDGNAKITNIANHDINASRSVDDVVVQLKFEGVAVKEADRIATNGVLHVVDGVIMLEHMLDILEVLKQRGATNFTNLLKENGLDVQNYPEVTLFVPPESSLQGLNASDLKNMLETHIVADLIELRPIRGLNGNESLVTAQSGDLLTVSVCSGLNQFPFTDFYGTINAHIGCSQIVAPNVHTCNGIIHFIDKPLTSAKLTVLELLKSRPELSQFLNMLERSSLKSRIDKDNFDGTVLAPNNNAIDAVFSGDQKQALLSDKKKLDLFVKRHIIGEALCEYQLSNAASPFTLGQHQSLAGELMYGRRLGGKLQIGQSPVSESELQATNGIVYILDRPITRRRLSSLWQMFGLDN